MSLAILTSCFLAVQAPPVSFGPSDVATPGWFGDAVDLDGDQLIVGAWLDPGATGGTSGSVHIYERQGAAWVRTFTAAGSGSERLGMAVAIDGDVAVVGASVLHPTPARVLQKIGGVWTETARLDYPQLGSGTYFDLDVDVEGDRIVLGATNALHQGRRTGAAYVFELTPSGWAQQAELLPRASTTTGLPPVDTAFGEAVVMHGDTIVVAASLARSGGLTRTGQLSVFERDPTGVWIRTETIVGPEPEWNDLMGRAGLALTDEWLAVGVPGFASGGIGSVLTFERTPTGWMFRQELDPLVPASAGRYGFSLGLEGDVLAVGRSSFEVSEFSDEDVTVDVYGLSASGTWVLGDVILDPAAAGDTGYGAAMHLDGGRLLVGAPRAWRDGRRVGTAYLHGLGSASAPIFSLTCAGLACACPAADGWRGCGNGTLRNGALTGAGSPSLMADDMSLTAYALPSSVVARTFMAPGLAPGQLFGDGVLCTATTLGLRPGLTSSDGVFVEPSGIAARSAALLGSMATFMPGETWVFQVVYVEPRALFGCTSVPHGSAGFNLDGRPYLVQRGFNATNGIAITFVP